ncbi:Multimodular transpeptidase-transglycosylase PBP 1A [Granulibacter bethesdensis CGDNIH1]|uniref:Multimodular transpeptidase-transglycosylase PBP 1A n=1 Tax=Granulibacter bethesdensis (strain ATCC BAA-1260 / CGDNIH1) TaxID=391165 RepID=Q0BV85_GRABC|nr:Multimodular transpeptidase-transglycosylase PBP 1A [Granulibacter bethesdensis CGDNIH1]APH51053.1 Multimodular transpeptidase-transglycosylase PBP 1A [Granulibacter bethesdensis]APH63747.1 Multimodular transpeptidase-transglycosylase PBP 1A [Granulibacter bethesdensis]
MRDWRNKDRNWIMMEACLTSAPCHCKDHVSISSAMRSVLSAAVVPASVQACLPRPLTIAPRGFIHTPLMPRQDQPRSRTARPDARYRADQDAVQDPDFIRRGPPPGRSKRRPSPPPPSSRRKGETAKETVSNRKKWRWLRWGIMVLIWGGLTAAVFLVYFAWDLPRPEEALDAPRRPSLILRDQEGLTFATYGDVVGESLRLGDMPRAMQDAAVSVEDRRFWSHGAIDPIGIARAIWVNLSSGRLRQGGSTITQQVAKTLFLSNERTLRRKVQELMLTIWLSEHFTRQEILEIWLNRVYLGAGAWGVDAAAHVYFGISARHLNIWQAAMLAGLPRAPSRFNPRVDPAAAIARTKEVLQAMVETHVLTAAQASAEAAKISFRQQAPTGAPWFADWAAERAQSLLPQGADAVIRTTLDSHIQSIAEARLTAMLDGPGAAANVHEAAVVVMDARTGAVRAMVGGADYRHSSFNRATIMRRQPGSSFKPFVWLVAMENGEEPDDTVSDAPIRVGNWSPSNYEPGSVGDITLETALAHSVNTAAVRLLLRDGGPAAVIEAAHRLGVEDNFPRNASIALGTADAGLLEMTAAYASFFNGGYRVTPRAIEAGTADHRPIQITAPVGEAVMTPEVSKDMTRMLQAVVARGTGRAASIPGHMVGGKTGTTQDYRDAWFIGCVDDRTVIGVWVGNDDRTPMRNITGGSLPARLFHDIAAALPPTRY